MENKGYITSSGIAVAVRPMRQFAVATYGLILLNLILFVGTLWGDPTDLAFRYALVPDDLSFTSLFTSIFLHFHPAHLVINVAFLWLFGRKVETALGPVEFLLFYIGSGFTASLLHVAISFGFLTEIRDVPVLGASGAISGVLGMYAIKFRNERITVAGLRLPAVSLLLTWLMIQVVLGTIAIFREAMGPVGLRNIGYWSHIGGFVFGMTAAWVTTIRKESRRQGSAAKEAGSIRRKTLLEIAHRYEALSASDPEDPFPAAELGRIWAFLGNQQMSTSNYLRAIELYQKAGRQEEALASIHDALRLWPESSLEADTAFRLACYMEALGEHERAAQSFAWLADNAQDRPEAEMALLKLGQVELDRLGRPDRATAALDRLMSQYPQSRWADLAQQYLQRARTGGRQ